MNHEEVYEDIEYILDKAAADAAESARLFVEILKLKVLNCLDNYEKELNFTRCTEENSHETSSRDNTRETITEIFRLAIEKCKELTFKEEPDNIEQYIDKLNNPELIEKLAHAIDTEIVDGDITRYKKRVERCKTCKNSYQSNPCMNDICWNCFKKTQDSYEPGVCTHCHKPVEMFERDGIKFCVTCGSKVL